MTTTGQPFLPRAALGKRRSRRSALRTFATAGLAFALLALAGQTAAQSPSQPYTVTVRTSLRSGPGADHAPITAITPGTTFTLTAKEENGFYGVNYNGMRGWIFGSLIVGGGSPDENAVMVGEAYVTTAVNLRSGPGTGFTTVRVVTGSSPLNVSNTVQNGFRYVVHEGLAGWLDDRFIAWRNSANAATGTTLTTSAPLNLREAPDLSAPVLVVMPPGSPVHARDGESNGFRKVSYDGTEGWAAVAYLNESSLPH